jgi:hypothetical protein
MIWRDLGKECDACKLRATPLVLSMCPFKLQMDEEKSKHASLAQQNRFGPSFLQCAEAGKRKNLIPAREECNKFDVAVAPCF